MNARTLKDRSGWYVELEWPNGRKEQICDFASEAEAQRWIDTDSTAWIEKAKERR